MNHCPVCSATFNPRPGQSQECCSVSCSTTLQWRRTWAHKKYQEQTKACRVCGEQYLRHERFSDAQWKQSKYCSRACQKKPLSVWSFFSEKNRWHVLTQDHKHIPWARILIWNQIGRPLKPTEVVHHINGDSTDDRLDNLILLPSKRAHALLEWAIKKNNILPERTATEQFISECK